MTLTIELTPEEETRLQEEATRAGVAPIDYVHRLLDMELTVLPENPTGAQIVEYWRAAGLIGSYGDPNLDSLEMARQLRTTIWEFRRENEGRWKLASLIEEKEGGAYIAGTGVKVRILAEALGAGYSLADLQEAYPQLTLAQLHAALAYYYIHKSALDSEIARLARLSEEHADMIRASRGKFAHVGASTQALMEDRRRETAEEERRFQSH